MTKFSDEQIIQSWRVNAKPWIKAIHHNEIESRVLVTNQAIIHAVMQYAPKKALDIGCGEGWLSHELINRGVTVFGIDIIPRLIETARQVKGGQFEICAYEDTCLSISSLI